MNGAMPNAGRVLIIASLFFELYLSSDNRNLENVMF